MRLYGWSRIQNRRVVRKLQRRVKITPGIGFTVVRLLLQSSNLLSIDPGTFSDACLLGGGECLHNANNWPIRRKTTRRSATSLVFAICAWLENFFSIPANSSWSMFLPTFSFAFRMFMTVINGDTESELSKCIVWNRRTCCQVIRTKLRVSSFFVVLSTCRFAQTHSYIYCRLKNSCETWKRTKR